MKTSILTGLLIVIAATSSLQASDRATWGEVKRGLRSADPLPGKMAVPQITVMTRNLYLGTDIDPVVEALASGDPQRIAQAVTAAWNNILANDFATRAQGLADEIQRHQPDVIGLQEVTTFTFLTSPPPGLPPVIDYLGLLLWELQQRGLAYYPAVSIENLRVPLPVPLGPSVGVIEYADREVILARADVIASNPQAGSYGAFVDIPGILQVKRGWVAVDAAIGGQGVRVMSTHLETRSFTPIQEAQAAELIGIAAPSSLPVILLGDFNSGPRAGGETGTQTYPMLLEAGFVDVWPRANPPADGFTCCHDELLGNPSVAFDRRIDLILVRDGRRTAPRSTVVAASHAQVVGDELAVLARYGLWPSDHAGVVASLRLPPAGRHPDTGGLAATGR